MQDQSHLLDMPDIKTIIHFFVNYVINRCGLEQEDVEQELRLHACAATKTFDPKEKHVTFVTYVWRRLRWRSQHLIRGWYRHKRVTEAVHLTAPPVLSTAVIPASPAYLAGLMKRKIKNRRAVQIIDLLQDPPREIRGPIDQSPTSQNDDIDFNRVAAYLGISNSHLRKSMRQIKKTLWEVLHGDK
jgi:DNA-directed RNA polymerase specialized sigma subunit